MGTEGLHTVHCLGRNGQGTEGNSQGWGRMDGAEVPRFSLAAWAQNHPLSESPRLPSPSAPCQASPLLFLHYTSSASCPSLGAQGCTETWGLGSGGGPDSRLFLVLAPRGPYAPWNPP